MQKVNCSTTKAMYVIAFALYVACYFVSAYNSFKIFGIEYVALAVLWSVGILDIMARRNGVFDDSMNYFSQCVNTIVATLILGGISLLFQIFHLRFKADLIKQMMFFMFPAITTMLVCNTREYSIGNYFTIVLFGAVIFFFVRFSSILTWETIQMLDFTGSYSPFEIGTTSIADIFFFCTVYFGYKKKFVRMGIAAAFGILSFKRLMVVAIVVVLVLSIASELKKKIIKTTRPQKVSKGLLWLTIFVVVSIPVFMQLLVSDEAMKYLSSLIGMDINDFAMGRLDLMKYIIDTEPTNYGLGTIASYMSNSALRRISGAGNVHNDLFRLLYETTVFGLFTYVYFIIKNTKRDVKTYALTVFFLINLAVSNSTTNLMPVLLFNLLCCEFLTGGDDAQERTTQLA